MFCFAVVTGKEPAVPSVNAAQLPRGNMLCSAPSISCKGLFMINAEGESSQPQALRRAQANDWVQVRGKLAFSRRGRSFTCKS